MKARNRAAAERAAAELRRERDSLADRLARLSEAYESLLCWSAALAAQHASDDELDALFVDEPVPSPLPGAVIADLAPLIEQSRRLAERAGLRRRAVA